VSIIFLFCLLFFSPPSHLQALLYPVEVQITVISFLLSFLIFFALCSGVFSLFSFIFFSFIRDNILSSSPSFSHLDQGCRLFYSSLAIFGILPTESEFLGVILKFPSCVGGIWPPGYGSGTDSFLSFYLLFESGCGCRILLKCSHFLPASDPITLLKNVGGYHLGMWPS